MSKAKRVVVLDTTKRAKYGNRKIEHDGIVFDSKKEYEYYLYLKSEKQAGRVLRFEVHHKEVLLESFKSWDGKTIREIAMYPDFVIWRDGELEFIDIKGGSGKWSTRTADWNNKWKLLQYHYRHQNNVKFTII